MLCRSLRWTSRLLHRSVPQSVACRRFVVLEKADANEKTSQYMRRHIGPQSEECDHICRTLGVKDLDDLMDKAVPSHIRLNTRLKLPEPLEEEEALQELKDIMGRNQLFKSYLGQGYYGTITPTVILRNLIENPSWYTPYTPYQAEISQGRMEMLLNFQTMISDLVGKPLTNASLLDEATSCAEAMCMAWRMHKLKRSVFLVSENVHSQNVAVVKTRADPLGIEVRIVSDQDMLSAVQDDSIFGVLVQYPNTCGAILDHSELTKQAHSNGSQVIAVTDLLACTMIQPPGDWGADIVVGSSQRFGVPMGFGGPHAGFLATDEQHVRAMPGRIIGVSKDSRGKQAYRLTLVTREQHIKRDRATSNICTAQALLANVSAAYAIYHGPKGLRNIGERVNLLTRVLAEGLTRMGLQVKNKSFFDTVQVSGKHSASEYVTKGWEKEVNLREHKNTVCISLDETTTVQDVNDLFQVFAAVEGTSANFRAEDLIDTIGEANLSTFARKTSYLSHPVFNSYHSETSMMRYLYSLERKDLGLNTAMIPLGSCTMKLNSATVMTPVTWPETNSLHPFVPPEQALGYKELTSQMEQWLAEVTGFDAVSLQPNSGAQGEYTGLMAIRAYHQSKGEHQRDYCLIPKSAHGTNPASAALVGWKIKEVKCDNDGNVNLTHLEELAEEYQDRLAACMITYPSTHGVFEEGIRELCDIIHKRGGLVYMDGANLQAQLGFCSPGNIGADVCHLNLHKTFCIPHGGGGPGLGPIGVTSQLAPFLPTHPIIPCGKDEARAIGPVAGAPWSSGSILPIPWMYIRMMGTNGLERATQVAIASANYMAARLEKHYKILYRAKSGFSAHEFIVDLRPLKKSAGITSEDVAKRLVDYGFHAPTMSWPVVDTLMIEPTESEPLQELDRMCDALIEIRQEIADIESGKVDIDDSVLRGAPHTVDMVCADEWGRKYSRSQAAGNRPNKTFWPSVGRINNEFGDTNLFCACPTVDELAD